MGAGPGFFVSLEGVDGSGKSTQASLLAARLREEGEEVTVVRDPGTTVLGERVRKLLLEKVVTAPDPFAEVALFLAARRQLLREVIEPSLAAGVLVISDRYLDSTLVYQGAGRGLDVDTLLELHRLIGAGRLPDLTLILDLDIAAARRRSDPALALDRVESEPTAYHERVRQGYLALAPRFPERVVVLSADVRSAALADLCWRISRERLAGRRAT